MNKSQCYISNTCTDNQWYNNTRLQTFVSVSTDKIQVTLGNSHNSGGAHLNLSQSSDKLPESHILLNNNNVDSNFSGFTVQHGYSSLCDKNNILATFNDTKPRQRILDKKKGFESVHISRVHNWEQDTTITATSMLQWAFKAHKLVSHYKVENYKNGRIT